MPARRAPGGVVLRLAVLYGLEGAKNIKPPDQYTVFPNVFAKSWLGLIHPSFLPSALRKSEFLFTIKG